MHFADPEAHSPASITAASAPLTEASYALTPTLDELARTDIKTYEICDLETITAETTEEL